MTPTRPLLNAAAARLRAAGVDTPRVDAELLLAACLGVERSRLPLVDALSLSNESAFAELLERRARREPLQHIVGSVAFRHLQLLVGPGVFVPRPETELLVDAVLPTLQARAPAIAVDLCAGSGALALAVAGEVPGSRVLAVECSPAALQWLETNTAASRVEVIAGDVCDPGLLRALWASADAVLCNPPYVPVATPVEPEVSADPAEAVFAGPRGLALMPAVIARSAQLLRSGGVVAIEHDDTHATALPRMLALQGDWCEIGAHRDLTGRPRYVTAVRR